MLFFSILFFIYSATLLVKGKLFRSISIENGEEEIKKQKLGTDNYKPNTELITKVLLLLFLFLLPLLVIESIYLTIAVKVDPFLYPSLAALSIFIGQFVIGILNGKKKQDLSTPEKVERYRKKMQSKRTVKGTLSSLLWTTYFGYMV